MALTSLSCNERFDATVGEPVLFMSAAAVSALSATVIVVVPMVASLTLRPYMASGIEPLRLVVLSAVLPVLSLIASMASAFAFSRLSVLASAAA